MIAKKKLLFSYPPLNTVLTSTVTQNINKNYFYFFFKLMGYLLIFPVLISKIN
ncbi:hypothetical protein SAMN04488522_1021340 [Pedobacter caeni]|uniref:Uncharacterized protein n=1 Tax=Pedobacter caeni TaxID=288992 RepID=A0A1M5BSX1_9SPHI|nr:hypothetical protein SAMN04488522_1021340 [Pedobacter caeni]